MARKFTRHENAPPKYQGLAYRVKAEHINELQIALEDDDTRINQKADTSAVHGMVVDEVANSETVTDAAAAAVGAEIAGRDLVERREGSWYQLARYGVDGPEWVDPEGMIPPIASLTPSAATTRDGAASIMMHGGALVVPSQHGSAWQVGEATTNYIANPAVATGTGWIQTILGATSERVTNVPALHPTAVKVTPTAEVGSGIAFVSPSRIDRPAEIDITPGAKLTGSFYLIATTHMRSWIRIIYMDGTTQDSPLLNFDPTGEVQRVELATVATDPAKVVNNIHLNIRSYSSADAPFWVSKAQVEPKDDPTPYVDGSLGPGHVWLGPENQSVSTRAYGYVTVAGQQVDPAEGTMLIRYRPHNRGINANKNYIVDLGDHQNADWISVAAGNVNDAVRAYFRNGLNEMTTLARPDIIDVMDEWNQVAVRWQGSRVSMRVNDSPWIEDVRGEIAGSMQPVMRIGRHSQTMTGDVEHILTYPDWLTDEQVDVAFDHTGAWSWETLRDDVSVARVQALSEAVDEVKGEIAELKGDGGALPEIATAPLLHFDAAALTIEDGARIASAAARVGPAFTQADPERQPLYDATSLNGRPAVRFDRTRGDALISGSVSTPNLSGTLFIVTAVDRATVNQWIAEVSGSGTRDLYVTGSGNLEARGVNIATSRFTHVMPHIIRINYGQSNVIVTVDGVETARIVLTTAPSAPPQALFLGNRASLAGAMSGLIGEALYYPTTVTGQDAEAVEGYLARKWGTTRGMRVEWHVSTLTGTAQGDGSSPARAVRSLAEALDHVSMLQPADATIYYDAPEGHEDRITDSIILNSGTTVRVVPAVSGRRWHLYGARKVKGGWAKEGDVWRRSLSLAGHSHAQAIIPRLRDRWGQPVRIWRENTDTPSAPSSGQFGYEGGVYYICMPTEVANADPNDYDIEIAEAGTLLAVVGGSTLHVEGGEVFGSRSNLIQAGSPSGVTSGAGTVYLRDMEGQAGFNCFATVGYGTAMIAHDSKALYAINDGWNHHAMNGHPAYMELNDCEGAWCADEGVSPHDDCILVINGGRYHHNGHGGCTSVTRSITYISDAEFDQNRLLDTSISGGRDTAGVSILEQSTLISHGLYAHDNPGPGVEIDVARGSTWIDNGNTRSGIVHGNGSDDVFIGEGE